MSGIYLDSSYVLSYLMEDAHSEEARNNLKTLLRSGKISELVLLEFQTMLRRKVGINGFKTGHAERIILELEDQIKEGWFEVVKVNWDRVWQRAMGLSARNAGSLKVRSLDILHVAVAMETGHDSFWTFDERQKELAELSGLRVI
jgi:predicted nucleic acid-binding protein